MREFCGNQHCVFCRKCGERLSKVFEYISYDEKTGEEIHNFYMKCLNKKSFLFFFSSRCCGY